MTEVQESTVNAVFSSAGALSLLSNLAHTPFEFRGIQFASVEGLIQGMKEEDPERQSRIFQQFGREAQRASSKARNARVQESGCVWFLGGTIAFRSDEYFAQVEEAIREKFQQNPDALAALVATGEARIIHQTGRPPKPNSALPPDRFTAILTQIRKETLHAR